MAEIDISSIKPNSHKYKDKNNPQQVERKKAKPVINKESIIKKKKTDGMFKKVVEFFADEEIEDGDVKNYILEEWVIPGVKDILWDVAATLLGDGGRRRSRGGRRNYNSYYKSSMDRGRRRRNRERDRHVSKRNSSSRYEADASDIDYRDIVITNRRDAEKVVDSLRARIKEYDEVSVAELLDLCNIAGDYTDNDWGWDDPNDIGIKVVKDGFLIDVSEAKYLK